MSEISKIVWHIGPQKTASTWIQNLLMMNHDHLAPELYELSDYRKLRMFQVRAERFGTTPRARTRLRASLANRFEAYREEAVAQGARTMLISQERFFGDSIYWPSGNLLTMIDSVLPLLAELSAPAKPVFVAYKRDYETWLKSVYSQAVRATRETANYDDWRSNVPFSNGFAEIEQRMRSATDAQVEVIDLEEERKSAAFVGEGLLKCADVSDEKIRAMQLPEHKNERLDKEVLVFLQQLNRLHLQETNHRHLRRLAIKNAEKLISCRSENFT